VKWTSEAETAIKKVPFFVRKRVRARVEKEAREVGKNVISLSEVKTTQKRYLTNMGSEIKGYQIDTCFGPNGCPNRANIADGLMDEIENLLIQEDLLSFLKQSVKGDLKFHHEFRVTLAECPNACSQPQIKDVGIIGAAVPIITDQECTRCEACVETCKESAIALDDKNDYPVIDFDMCLKCGKCMAVCPTGTLETDYKGFRVQLGGKLGRHPRLARELPGIYTEAQVLSILKDCLALYKQLSIGGRRFADILTDAHFDELARRYDR
jgi:dissimilatory sulfite reductase (desulfoviridin) alpha/beta subunit